MSYEGYYEFLCKQGHLTGCDCYDTEPTQCPHCGEAIAWRHSVDQTNGEIDGDPSTMPGAKALIAHQEVRHTDHRGNEYFTLRARYRPIGDQWHRVS